MRKFKILVIVLLCSLNTMFAQKSKKKIKVYKVWISKIDNSKIIKGNLYEVNDESLKIIGNRYSEIIVDVKDIHKIKIRKKGKIGKGAGIGALTGIATGALIGFVSGDDPDEIIDGGWLFGTYSSHGTSAGEKAAIWGVSLGAAGSIVGAVLGTKKEIFLIDGDIKKYQSHFDKLLSYSMNRKN